MHHAYDNLIRSHDLTTLANKKCSHQTDCSFGMCLERRRRLIACILPKKPGILGNANYLMCPTNIITKCMHRETDHIQSLVLPKNPGFSGKRHVMSLLRLFKGFPKLQPNCCDHYSIAAADKSPGEDRARLHPAYNKLINSLDLHTFAINTRSHQTDHTYG